MELFKRNNKVQVKLDTAKDRIAAYMIGQVDEDELSLDDKKMMDRWAQIWTLLNNYHSPAQAVEAHIRMCENKGEEISRRTAYRDLRFATDIWGDASRISKRSMLVLLYEFALKSFQLAAKGGNISEMNKSVANLIKVAKETEEFYDNDAEGHIYVLELHTKGGQSKTINLDHLNEIKKNDYYEIIEAVEDDEIDVLQMKQLLTEETNEEAAQP